MTWVKVCGVTRAEDLRACVDAGVDAVGFNFWPGSRRFVPPESVAVWVAGLPARVAAVGVTVGASPDEVRRMVGASGVSVIQLHGDEDPWMYQDVGASLLPVVRIGDASSLPEGPLPGAGDRVVLDARVPGYGGAGARFDWSLVPEAARRLRARVVLAGGLDPGNVAEALRVARPFGVDVASGVESAPGIKDPARVRAFVRAARGG